MVLLAVSLVLGSVREPFLKGINRDTWHLPLASACAGVSILSYAITQHTGKPSILGHSWPYLSVQTWHLLIKTKSPKVQLLHGYFLDFPEDLWKVGRYLFPNAVQETHTEICGMCYSWRTVWEAMFGFSWIEAGWEKQPIFQKLYNLVCFLETWQCPGCPWDMMSFARVLVLLPCGVK